MKHHRILLGLLLTLGCQEREVSEAGWVQGTVVSTQACTGNGVIIEVATAPPGIRQALDAYGGRREITVFSSELAGVAVGDPLTFTLLDLNDTARVCLMQWESPRGPDATIQLAGR